MWGRCKSAAQEAADSTVKSINPSSDIDERTGESVQIPHIVVGNGWQLLLLIVVVAAALADGCWQLVNLKKELVPFACNSIIVVVVVVVVIDEYVYMYLCLCVCACSVCPFVCSGDSMLSIAAAVSGG